MRKRIAAIWVAAGVILGPPAVGAVSSLFWSRASHGADAPKVAERLYREIGINRAAEPFSGTPDLTPSCLSFFDRQYINRPNGGDIDYTVVASGLRNFAFTRMQIALDDPGVAALRELPAPALGALDACIFGSPLSPLCRSIAHDVADRATRFSPAEVERVRRQSAAEVERIACKALDLPDAATARSGALN